MNLHELQKNWDAFGRTDPFWAILTTSSKRGGRWDTTEFFNTGLEEIANTFAHLQTMNVEVRREAALDFGCGVGRLTQALGHYFDTAYGVDIAPSMIDLAKRYNRLGERCHYVLNENNDLTVFSADRFDFIYSSLVLQHMRPEYSIKYISEFMRVLRAGGIMVFQLPSPLADDGCKRDNAQTGIGGALPDNAFKAGITLLDRPMRLEPGSQHTLHVRVTNMSSVVWRARGKPGGGYEIRLGNHWLNERAQPIAIDDARTSLPYDLAPQQSVDLDLTVTAPARPGTYVLEVDMVQEAVSWFGAKGSSPSRLRVTTEGGDWIWRLSKRLTQRSLVSRSATDAPIMEMYTMPREQVVETIERRGGRVISIQGIQDKDWESLHYYITK